MKSSGKTGTLQHIYGQVTLGQNIKILLKLWSGCFTWEKVHCQHPRCCAHTVFCCYCTLTSTRPPCRLKYTRTHTHTYIYTNPSMVFYRIVYASKNFTLLYLLLSVLWDYLACYPLYSSPQPAFDGHFNRHHLIFIDLLRWGFNAGCGSVLWLTSRSLA